MQESQEVKPSPFTLAAGMLAQDKFLLCAWLFLLILAPSLDLSFNIGSQTTPLVGLIIERLSQLLVIYFITLRWVNRLSSRPVEKPNRIISLLSLLIFGFLLWLILITPVICQLLPMADDQRILVLSLLLPAIYLWLKSYFYFFAIVIGKKGFKEIWEINSSILNGNPYVPFYTMMGPFALMSLIMAIFNAIAPDGRYIFLSWLEGACSGIFWILSSYLSLSFALHGLSERHWHEAGLDPYRDGRFSTICLNAKKQMVALLNVKNGAKVFVISLLIWFANLLRLETMPPTAKIEVKRIIVAQETTTIELTADDSEFNLRNFQPIQFILAGNERSALSGSPQSVIETDSGADMTLGIPPGRQNVTLTLTFKTLRPGEAMKQLQDVFLWYRYAKLLQLDLQKGVVSKIITAG